MSVDFTDGDAIAGTARWVAAARARETARTDRLFDDPWAAALAGSEGAEWLERMAFPPGRGGSDLFAIRTRYFDDFLLRVTAEHQIHQVVILAAGMDARGFRLAWPPQTHLFELDQPQVLSLKDQILAAAGATAMCQRRAVGVDLSGPWVEALLAENFVSQQPAVWLMEGFLFYLPEPVALSLLDTVSAIASSGSWLGLDIVNRATLTSPWTKDWIESLSRAGARWQFAIDEPEELLAARGWSATVVHTGDKDANFGRWPYPVVPRSMRDVPRSLMVTACRK